MPVFAALVAIINTKLPQVRELVLMRIISRFSKSFKRNNKVGDFFMIDLFLLLKKLTTYIFIRSSIIPQQFSSPILSINHAYEVGTLQILVLLERPTDYSIEITVSFTCEVGVFLSENSLKANATVFKFKQFWAV